MSKEELTDEEQVRAANERFYMAMNTAEIGEMDEVWADEESAICVHPGREAIFGYERIRESWETIFSSANSLSIAAGNERINVVGDMAWVSCIETISLMMEGGLAAAAAQSTNIFRRTPQGRWRMLVHHASPIPFMTQDEWPDVIN
ncbi:MAG TPA: nuclear transport factor 2 family protein [Pyrinomonadaceae bacterium]|jgi:ketosteroid isomerase-like protein